VGARSRPGSNLRFRSSGSERARARSNGYTRPVITDWLGTISLAEFATAYRGRAPIAQPRTASAACSLLDWDVLDRVLRAVPDALVVARGALLNMPSPGSVDQLRVYFAAGIGLCIRHAARGRFSLPALAVVAHGDLPPGRAVDLRRSFPAMIRAGIPRAAVRRHVVRIGDRR
jgi:hypothetical protein